MDINETISTNIGNFASVKSDRMEVHMEKIKSGTVLNNGIKVTDIVSSVLDTEPLMVIGEIEIEDNGKTVYLYGEYSGEKGRFQALSRSILDAMEEYCYAETSREQKQLLKKINSIREKGLDSFAELSAHETDRYYELYAELNMRLQEEYNAY